MPDLTPAAAFLDVDGMPPDPFDVEQAAFLEIFALFVRRRAKTRDSSGKR